MYYTFAQAKEKLARFADGGCTDPGSAINDAVERLMNTDQWRDLQRLMRMVAVRNVISLPQNVETILRYSINGVPGKIYGTEYQFLSSGPGDRDFSPAPIYPVGGLNDLGSHYPVMFDPDPNFPCYLVAFSASADDAGKSITVYGCNAKNEDVVATLPIQLWLDHVEGRVGSDEEVSTRRTLDAFVSVSSVVLPAGLSAYVSMYGMQSTASDMWFLGKYHPAIMVPTFRRYRIVNGASDSDNAILTAEIKVRFTPLVADTDIIPFDTLHAVKLMLQSISYENAGNIQSSVAYRNEAVTELANVQASKEVSHGMPHLINFDLTGSIGGSATCNRIL